MRVKDLGVFFWYSLALQIGIRCAKFVENGILYSEGMGQNSREELTELSQVFTVPLVMREANREANSLSNYFSKFDSLHISPNAANFIGVVFTIPLVMREVNREANSLSNCFSKFDSLHISPNAANFIGVKFCRFQLRFQHLQHFTSPM